MEAKPLHLLVILLCFSSLISTNAAPITRGRKLMMETQDFAVSDETHLKNGEESVMMMSRRMDAEVNDYPWSGANNRHNPTPRPGRVCVDCN